MTTEHHVLIAKDWDCPIVLAGCYRKIKRHDKAEIYTSSTIVNCRWNTTIYNSWKLHVIVHGDYKLCPSCSKPHPVGFVPGISAPALADMVKNSKLPNKLGAKIRLDICFSGMGGPDSLAYQLKKNLGLNSNYSVSGVKGASVPGWGTDFSLKKTRMVIGSTNIDQLDSKVDLAKKEWGDAMANYKKSWWCAKILGNLAKPDSPSKKFKILAKLVHLLGEKTVKEFYNEIRSKGLVLDKTQSENYKIYW